MATYQTVQNPYHVQDENGDIVGYQKDPGNTLVYTPRYKTDSSGNVTGLVGPSGGVIPFAVKPYVGAVASRCGISQSVGGAGNPQSMARTRHVAMDQVISPQIVYGNWVVNSSNTEVSIAGTATIEASIEYPIGTFTRVTFSGSNSGSCPAGSNLVSDAASVSIPKGAVFFVRTYWLSAAGMPYVIGNGLNNATGTSVTSGEYFQYGASVSNTVMGGTINNTSVSTLFKPLAIIGPTSRVSWFSAGDSRLGLGGSGATYDTASDALGLLGEHERYLGRDYAVIHAGRSGDSVRAATTNGYTLRLALSQYCSHIACEYGFNDLDAGARTATVILADLVTFAAYFSGKPFWQSTISPASTSTDSFATTVNQTTKASNAQRVLLNAAIRFGSAPFHGVFEVADQMESARDSGLWKAPGYTVDGIHGNQLANTNMQASIVYPRI